MGERSLSGYAYHDRIAVGFYGEVFRAHDQDGVEVRIVHVDPKLCAQAGFAESLLAQEERLRVLEHEGVVATRAIRRAAGGGLAVVTDAVAGPVHLDVLMRDSGGKLPADVALAVATGAIEGLAYAHSLRIVHGCVHPRSVVIDFHGRVKVADFGLALAWAGLIASSRGSALATSATGYLPPELASGAAAAVAGDVYAAGALLSALLAGAPPPARLDTTAAVQKLVGRALAAEPSRRFLNGTELEETLDEAVIADGCRVAMTEDVAAYVTEQRSRAERDLDRATEDLLAEINSPEPAPDRSALPKLPKPKTRPGFEFRSPSDAEAEALAAVEAAGREVESEGFDSVADLAQAVVPSFAASAEPEPVPVPLVDEALFELEREAAGDLGGDSEIGFDDIPSEADHTRVDDPDRLGVADSISQIIRLSKPEEGATEPAAEEDENTPLPEPVPHHERPDSITAGLEAAAAQEGKGATERDEREGREEEVGDVLDSLEQEEQQETDEPRGREPPVLASRGPAAAPAATPIEPAIGSTRLDVTEALARPRQGALLWLSLSVLGAASLFGVLYTQTDMFHPERAAARDQQRERDRKEAIARHAAEQPTPGEIEVDSSPGEAAVWLLLGRAPVESFPLPAGMVHEMRLEHEGYHPLDLPVTAIHWSEAGGDARAVVRGKLVPGEPPGPPPAYPPQPDAPHPSAGLPGNGVIQVESDPPGAQVWLLVGFTPKARLSGIEAGRDYEFKLLKDGFRPGFAVVRAGEWYLSGPGSPLRPSLSRSVELAPSQARDESGGEPRKWRRKRRR